MSRLPIILLAFSNETPTDARHLRNLPLEESKIMEALDVAEQLGMCEVKRCPPNASLEDIINLFQRYHNRIAVFHYGGHANGFQLLLNSATKTEMKSAHSAGFIPFLKSQEGLKLVFFNGCSTKIQAEELSTDSPISTISTSRSVNDEVARKCAIRFYKGLANQLTIAKAWQAAEQEVYASFGKANTRDLVWEGSDEEEETALWNVIINDQNWKLMKLSAQEVLRGMLGLWGDTGQQLIHQLEDVESVLPFNQDIGQGILEQLKSQFKEKKVEKMTLRALEGAVKDNELEDAKEYYEQLLEAIQQELDQDTNFAQKLNEVLRNDTDKEQIIINNQGAKIGQQNVNSNVDNSGATFNF